MLYADIPGDYNSIEEILDTSMYPDIALINGSKLANFRDNSVPWKTESM